jgi:hypothetical protein
LSDEKSGDNSPLNNLITRMLQVFIISLMLKWRNLLSVAALGKAHSADNFVVIAA